MNGTEQSVAYAIGMLAEAYFCYRDVQRPSYMEGVADDAAETFGVPKALYENDNQQPLFRAAASIGLMLRIPMWPIHLPIRAWDWLRSRA